MSNSGAYIHHANATTKAHSQISIFSLTPLTSMWQRCSATMGTVPQECAWLEACVSGTVPIVALCRMSARGWKACTMDTRLKTRYS